MIETDLSPIHSLPSGLCEDPSQVASTLLGRMAQDDPAALTELHALWCPVLLGIAFRMLGDFREAEEAILEMWVRIWHGAAEYNPHQSPPFVWAFAILRGVCIERLRSRHRASKKDASSAVQIAQMTAPEKPDNSRVMPMDDFRRVRAALNALTSDERCCLELAVFLKYTHSEILKHPETPMGTVKNHLRQALKKMRNHLSRYEL
jgi:RNA polymerase sigma-70 factor (ECF subfamily)